MSEKDISSFRIIPLYDMTQYVPLGDALDEIEISAHDATSALEEFRRKTIDLGGYWDWDNSINPRQVIGNLSDDEADLCEIALGKEIAFRPAYYSMRTLEQVSFQKVFQVHLAVSETVLQSFYRRTYNLATRALGEVAHGSMVLGGVGISEITHWLASWMYDAAMLEFLVLTGYDKLYPAMVMNDLVLDVIATQHAHQSRGLFVCKPATFGGARITGDLVGLFDSKRAAVYPAMLGDIDSMDWTPEVKRDYLTSANPPILLNGGSDVLIRTVVLGRESIYCMGGIPVLKTKEDQWRLHVLSCCDRTGRLVRTPQQEGFLKDTNTYYPGESN